MASPPQRAYTPLQTGNIALPPNKRQRLSPGPSPLGTNYDGSYQQPPNYAYPNNGYNHNPVHQFNQPQPHSQLPPIDTGSRPAPGNMGPPERPKADKATDINDLNDLVTAAGVDLKAEENYLAATYRNKHQDNSFSTSFGTTSSSTISPENSFQQWSQGSYGQYPAFQPNGPFSQPQVSQRSVEDEIKAKHERAARQRNDAKQVHLKDPFLATDPMRIRLEKQCYENQVRLDVRGLNETLPPPPVTANDVRGTSMVTADEKNGVVAATSHRTLNADAPLVEILTLLSLACQERMRSLAEDAYAISRSRQYGSHGIVPPEWATVATGEGVPKDATARSQSITGTAWDQAPNSAVSPLAVLPPKRNPSDSTARLPTPPTEPDAPEMPTIAYPSPIPLILKDIAKADREAEKRRLERRKKRERERQSSAVDDVSSPTVGSPSTPSADANAPPKLTKKELAKAKGAQLTEDYMHKQANQTAAMALGGGKKKYAWMTAGSAPAASGGLGAGVGLGRGSAAASRTASGIVPTAPQEDAGLKSKEYWKKLGEFREDGPKGQGVQIRDLMVVVERDGLEKKTLARCLAKLSSKDDQR